MPSIRLRWWHLTDFLTEPDVNSGLVQLPPAFASGTRGLKQFHYSTIQCNAVWSYINYKGQIWLMVLYFLKKGEALYLLNKSKHSPQRTAQYTVTVMMSSTSLQSSFLHEGSQLEKNIIILQYSGKANFYHKTHIYLQYNQLHLS
jgi:hypothetical protein